MKKCKYCQAEMPQDSAFCPNCGKQADTQPDEEAVPVQQTIPEAPHAAEGQTSAAEPVREEPAADPEKTPKAEAPVEESVPAGDASPEEVPSAQIKEGIQATPGRIALAVAAVIVLLAVLIALIVAGLGEKQPTEPEAAVQTTAATEATVSATIPADGNPGDVTCKGSYTVADEEAAASRDTVVATMGDRALTNGALRVYYWMEVQGFLSNYGAYAAYFGMDYTQPLDTQLSMEENNLTWQQYFLQCALDNWRQIQAMATEADNAKMEMNEEDRAYLENLESTVQEMADSYNMSVDELLLNNFGPGTGMEEYAYFQELYHRGYPYYEAETAKLVPTQAELKEFYEAHREDYANGGVTEDSMFADVRHILIRVEGGTTDGEGNTTYSEEEWEACRKEAQAILDEWLAGDKTEDSFAVLATEKSEDPGSQSIGGLYKKIYEGQMVPAFNDWCFDESRESGDYGLVQTDYGYHVMYFVSSQPQWEYYAESDWVGEQTNKLIEDLLENYPMEVEYEKITLGNVNMGA